MTLRWITPLACTDLMLPSLLGSGNSSNDSGEPIVGCSLALENVLQTAQVRRVAGQAKAGDVIERGRIK